MWKLNNMLLNNQWVKEEIKREIRKYFKLNASKNTMHSWEAIREAPRGKSMALNSYIRNSKKNFKLMTSFLF